MRPIEEAAFLPSSDWNLQQSDRPPCETFAHLDPLEGVEVAGEGALADRPDAALAQLEAHEGREAGERQGLRARRQWSGHYRAHSKTCGCPVCQKWVS